MQDDGIKPEQYKAVRVWLADGTRVLGVWTGQAWLSAQGEIKPARWELKERKKKTKKLKKLRKALRVRKEPKNLKVLTTPSAHSQDASGPQKRIWIS